jgi:beta-N-acetylhexosaminidase
MDPARGVRFAAGQAAVVRMEDRATPSLLGQAQRGRIGGVILFPDPEIKGKRLARELRRLQAAAAAGSNPPLLVSIDQEGGPVERLPALPPQLSPSTLRENDDRRAAKLEGRATGFQLRELGINVNLAPALDVPASAEQFMAPRAFGFDSGQARRLGLAFMRGMRRESVAATAKHFPGLGRAQENTDFAPTTITAGRVALERDIEPFDAAAAAGIDLVMVSSAAYPALGSDDPAVLAPEIATALLRGELGFGGVAISDDLLAPAVAGGRSRAQVAQMASAAGVDLLLYARSPARGIRTDLLDGVAEGSVDAGALRASCERILSLKTRLASGQPL